MRNRAAAFLLVVAAFLSFPQASGAQWVQANAPKGGIITSFAVIGSNLFAGTEHVNVWRLPLSEDSLKKAQSSWPDYPAAGLLEDKIVFYRQAVGLLPSFTDGWKGLGECYALLGHTDKAITAYKQVVKLEPKDAEAWYALGGCYEKAGRKEDADKAFERARKLKPELLRGAVNTLHNPCCSTSTSRAI